MPIGAALFQCARAHNLDGLPAISVPCGLSSSGLPIGLHLTGRAFDEPTVLRVAYAYEQATSWHTARPPL
jgi:aspartyl-tRNA(Asn)/glutamyl-tRNA(Gln) amidotransferase subunit A